MVSILKILLQSSLHRPLCANRDNLYFYQIYSLRLETLGAFKIVIFLSTSLKFCSLNRKLQILNLAFILKIRLQTSMCRPLFSVFFLRHPVYIYFLLFSGYFSLWTQDNRANITAELGYVSVTVQQPRSWGRDGECWIRKPRWIMKLREEWRRRSI